MSTPSNYAYGTTPQPPARPRRSGMTKAGRWMFLVGLVLSLLAVGAIVWGITQAVRVYEDAASDLTTVDGSTTVSMEAGSMRLLLSAPEENPSCTVTGPDGATVPVETDPAFDTAGEGSSYKVVGGIAAQESGDHVVECTGGQAMLSGAVDSSAFLSIAAVGIGFLALLPLGLLTLIGLVLWLVGRSRDNKPQTPSGGYGYPGQSPTGYPGNYPSAPTGYPTSTGYGHQGQNYGQGQNPTYPPPPPSSFGTQGSTDDPYAPPPPPPGNRP